MNNLVKAFNEIRSMEYKSRKGDDVEDFVAEIIGKHLGCRPMAKPSGASKEWWDRIGKHPYPYIVTQPNGSQQSPDVSVFISSTKRIDIECKRSKNGSATWNSGYPKSKNIYVYNGEDTQCSTQKTTFCLGEALLSDDEAVFLSELQPILNQLKDSYNKGALKFSRFKLQHLRPMFTETGHNKWLSHPDKHKREQAVINFVSAIYENNV